MICEGCSTDTSFGVWLKAYTVDNPKQLKIVFVCEPCVDEINVSLKMSSIDLAVDQFLAQPPGGYSGLIRDILKGGD